MHKTLCFCITALLVSFDTIYYNMFKQFGINNNGDEMTQKEVADLLGISQSYISRLEKRIIKRLRKDMNKMINS